LNPSGIKNLSISDLLQIMGDVPQSEHLYVYLDKEVIATNPIPYPFRSDNYSFLFVLSGKMSIQLNLITHAVEANDLIIIAPKTVVHTLGIEGNLRLIGISFTTDFALYANGNRSEMDAFEFFTSKIAPKLPIGKDDLGTFILLSELLHKKNTENNPHLFGNEMVSHAFNLLAYEVAALYKKQHAGLKTTMSRRENLTLKFLKTLEHNFRSERSVQFYADSLFVTNGHLARVLREVSGKTARTLIDEAVIMEARLLLADPSLTVAQIADQLQFSDQSAFGKFFKKSIGCSPSAYRKRNG